MRETPRLSIGVPVYNGAKYITETLESLLAQTFTDCEIIISDNASTDATPQICEAFAQRDGRIRYMRSAVNLGPAPNYNRCVELARGEFFKWQAADDLIEPTFCERCIQLLDANPQYGAVYTKTKLIDLNSQQVGVYQHDLELDSPSGATRMKRFLFANHKQHTAHELWGVMRMETLRSTSLKGSFPSADRVMIASILAYGPMGRVDEPLFCNREHPNRSTYSVGRAERRLGSKLSRYIGGGPTPAYEWWDAKMRGRITFPEWKWLAEYVKAIQKSPMKAGEKVKCVGVLALLYAKFVPRLVRDVLIAAELSVYRGSKWLTPRRTAAKEAETNKPVRSAA